MPKPERLCVLVEIDGSDPRLDDRMIATRSGTAALRQAVVEAITRQDSRVVATIPVPIAKLAMEIMDDLNRAAGEGPIPRPPRDYVPPAGRR